MNKHSNWTVISIEMECLCSAMGWIEKVHVYSNGNCSLQSDRMRKCPLTLRFDLGRRVHVELMVQDASSLSAKLPLASFCSNWSDCFYWNLSDLTTWQMSACKRLRSKLEQCECIVFHLANRFSLEDLVENVSWHLHLWHWVEPSLFLPSKNHFSEKIFCKSLFLTFQSTGVATGIRLDSWSESRRRRISLKKISFTQWKLEKRNKYSKFLPLVAG